MPTDRIRIAVTATPVGNNVPDHIVIGEQPNGFTVPVGKHWAWHGYVKTNRASVVVRGRLSTWNAAGTQRMAAWLHIANVDEHTFKGGPVSEADLPSLMVSDPGVYVRGAGWLDLDDNPADRKFAWGYGQTNHPTWQASDHMVACPLKYSEVSLSSGFAAHTLNAPLRPMPDGRKIPVLNLTRRIQISGSAGKRSHIHVQSIRSSKINYVEISHMAPQRFLPDPDDPTEDMHPWRRPQHKGRYGLHFHQEGLGSLGTEVIGTVIKNCFGWAVATHESHNVTFRDTIVYDSGKEGFTWDAGTITNNVVYDHCVAAFVNQRLGGVNTTGWRLDVGHGGKVLRCLAVGIGGTGRSSGYKWPELPQNENQYSDGEWDFVDNTALACARFGTESWQNTQRPHTIATTGKFTAINCGALNSNGNFEGGGNSNGAYFNRYHHQNVEIYNVPGARGITLHALTAGGGAVDNQRWQNIKIRGGRYGIDFTRHARSAQSGPVLLLNIDVANLDTGGKKVYLNSAQPGLNSALVPGLYDIVTNDPALLATGITPADVGRGTVSPGTTLRIQRGAQAWRLVDNGTATAITIIQPFYPYA